MKKLSLKEIIIKFNNLHNTEEFRKEHGFDHYDYSLITEENYINTQHKVVIKCNIHNKIFSILASEHNYGKGCNKCGWERTSKKVRMTVDKVIERFKQIHKDRYDYSKVVYVGMYKKICIV